MENHEKIQLLSKYVGGKIGLDWQQDIVNKIRLDGYGSDRTQDFSQILTDPEYKIFSAALDNKTNGNQRFLQVFDHLSTLYLGQHNIHTEELEALKKILTTEKLKAPNAPSRGHPQVNETPTEQTFLILKKNISQNKNLQLFNDLLNRIDNQTKAGIVENLVNNLCAQRTFNKSTSGVITESFNGLLGIIRDHSGGTQLQAKNFKKLMGITEDGSYSHDTRFFTNEIMTSFSKEEGLTKMKEFLDISGIKDDKQKNEYIKNFVKNFFAEDAIGIDKEKLLKLDHYIKEACEKKVVKIFEIKNEIVGNLYIKNTSCKLDESFLDFVLKQEGPITSMQLKNLIIHLGSINKVQEELKKRAQEKRTQDDYKIEDVIHGGRVGVANDCEFLRKVLQRSDENLLKELIGGSQPLINEEQIFASVNYFSPNNQTFHPIREAFNKNQDLSSLNSLAFLFSKLSADHASEILSDLIPLPQNPQAQANQPLNNTAVDNFLTNLLSRNFNSAKMLIDIANKGGFQDNVKSSISKFINTYPINGNDCIALLSMVADNGPVSLNVMQNNTQTSVEFKGVDLFREVLIKNRFYDNQDSPATLLSQNNPASLALFFEKTGGVETQQNQQMISKLCEYLRNPHNQTIKDSDACQNSLMFLLTKNQRLEETFSTFLKTDNLKKTDDKKLIKTIHDSIFAEKDGQILASDLQRLNIDPLLEAGKIFQYFDNQNVRNEKTNISLGLGKKGVLRINKENEGKPPIEISLPNEISALIALNAIGYDLGKNNPTKLNDVNIEKYATNLNVRLMQGGFHAIRPAKVPATAVGPAGSNAVSQTPGLNQSQ